MTGPGARLGGGWTRVEGYGQSVDFDPLLPTAVASNPVPLPVAEPQPADDPDVGVPGWLAVPDEPIVGYARDVLGFELYPGQAATLSRLYRDAYRILVARMGRRSGKDRMAATLIAYESTANADAHLAHVPPGEQISMVIVATSQAQARRTLRYVRGFLSRPMAGVRIVSDSTDELELSNGIRIEALPCTARSTRGATVPVLVMTEAAWFIDSDGSPLAAQEVWNALSPSVAQFPEGRICVLSSPRWATGWFANTCRQAASDQFADMLHVWATTAQMNPKLATSGFLEREQARDPVMFRREYEAAFVAGLSAVFPDALVRLAVTSQAPQPIIPGRRYLVSLDASSGTGKDTFAATSGSIESEHVDVRDVRGWRGTQAAPINHRAVLDEVAIVARAHNGATVLIDQYASEPIRQGLAERGVSVRLRAWTNESKEEAVTITRQLFHQSRITIPEHSALIGELVMLEQHLMPSGRSRYEAPRGSHDDYATALLALAHELSTTGHHGSTDQSWIA